MPSYCKGCAAEIAWVKTRKGKNMPVDVEPVNIDDLKDDDVVVDRNGKVSQVQNADKTAEPFRISHFATCPDKQ